MTERPYRTVADSDDCPVEGCVLVELHDLEAHDWTQSPESRVADYLRD